MRFNITVGGIPTDADSDQVYLTIIRQRDNFTVVNNVLATHAATGQYAYTLNPNQNSGLGRHKVTWNYTLLGNQYPRTEFYDVVIAYTTASEVKSEYPNLSSKSDDEIYRKEKLARNIIETFCNQKFEFELAATKKVEGQDRDQLWLPKRLYSLDTVTVADTNSNQADITADVELLENFILQATNVPIQSYDPKRDLFRGFFFRSHTIYQITGDWGWESVPQEISQAAMLLINDYFDDDNLLRQHGIYQAHFGDNRYLINADFWATTGNYDVDILLSNFADSGIQLI